MHCRPRRRIATIAETTIQHGIITIMHSTASASLPASAGALFVVAAHQN